MKIQPLKKVTSTKRKKVRKYIKDTYFLFRNLVGSKEPTKLEGRFKNQLQQVELFRIVFS
jgi:hypothetical protein